MQFRNSNSLFQKLFFTFFVYEEYWKKRSGGVGCSVVAYGFMCCGISSYCWTNCFEQLIFGQIFGPETIYRFILNEKIVSTVVAHLNGRTRCTEFRGLKFESLVLVNLNSNHWYACLYKRKKRENEFQKPLYFWSFKEIVSSDWFLGPKTIYLLNERIVSVAHLNGQIGVLKIPVPSLSLPSPSSPLGLKPRIWCRIKQWL